MSAITVRLVVIYVRFIRMLNDIDGESMGQSR